MSARLDHVATEAAEGSTEALVGLRQQRVRQILWILIASFSLLAVMNVASGHYTGAVLEGLAMLLLGIGQWRNASGASAAAARLALGTMLVVLVALMAAGEGLMDEVPIAYPALLIFAGMFGSRRLLVLATAVMLASLVAMALWHSNTVSQALSDPPLQRLVVLSIIVCVTMIFLLLVTGDVRHLVRDLEAETAALAQSNARITELAYYDELTGLPNRTMAKEHLRQLLLQLHARDARPGASVVVIFIDLDHFKTVNDSLCHDVGDELLREVAQCLKASLRPSDMVAHLSGDEFLVLLGPLDEGDTAVSAVARLMAQLAPSFMLHDMQMHVTGSLGVCVAPQDGDDVDTLLKKADLAMYEAKASGRNAFRFFDPRMDVNMLEYLQLASALRTAVEKGEMQLHYQPQLDLASGCVTGAEALLRWQHPEMGWVSPARFIPVAESSGLIHELGSWVLHRACADLRGFHDQGLAHLSVAVNVSALQFRRGHIDYKVINSLAGHDLPPGAIELEITESVLVDDSEKLDTALERLHAAGVRIAIDDFGTGYSNLGYLQRHAVRRLKIDQSFTRAMLESERADGIVHAIIEMAHCLRMEVVAEGVEDAATLARLKEAGCEFGQGFYWSPAIPAREFAAFAKARLPEPAAATLTA